MPSPAVQRGAFRLDAEIPGWYRLIDTDRLDLTSDRDCILGQLYRRYGYGVLALTDTPRPETRLGNLWLACRLLCPWSRLCRWAAWHGFLPVGGDEAENDLLRDEWVAVIDERLAAVACVEECVCV